MKNKEFKLSKLKLRSFITSEEQHGLKGGTITTMSFLTVDFTIKDPVYEISKREVESGCWASEETGPS